MLRHFLDLLVELLDFLPITQVHVLDTPCSYLLDLDPHPLHPHQVELDFRLRLPLLLQLQQVLGRELRFLYLLIVYYEFLSLRLLVALRSLHLLRLPLVPHLRFRRRLLVL